MCAWGSRCARLLAFGLTLSSVGASAGQSPPAPGSERPSIRAVRVEQAPTLDGNVTDDPAWQAAEAVTEFWQTNPNAGAPATEATEVRIVYTADALYIGAVLRDRSPDLTVSDSRRDSSLDDVDSFRIILDTYRDRQNGFVFGTNPAALEFDGQVTNEGGNTGVAAYNRQQSGSGGGFNINWDGAWAVRTMTFEGGWSAEFEIPFRTLRYDPGEGRTWGVNFQRTLRRRKEHAYWAQLPMQFDLMRVSQAGSLTGLDLPAPRSFRLMPYVLSQSRKRGTLGESGAMLGDVGIDTKYMVTPSLTLDTTVNTDFAQVEVDDQQINLDRFNLFFPEKRPFFLENAGLFAVGSPSEAELFFSRRIGINQSGQAIPIIAGARLSGRAGPVNVGLVNMQTDSVGTSSPANNFTVARVRKDWGRSNLGAMFVGRQRTGDVQVGTDSNQAMGIDGRWGIKQTGLVSGYVARTRTPGVSGDQQSFQIGARNETRPLTLALTYTDVGRNFNPEVGFLSRTGGFRKLDGQIFSRIRPTSRVFQEFRPHMNYRTFWDPTGFQQTGYLHLDSHTEFKNWTEMHTGMNVTREGVAVPFEIYPGVFVPAGTYDHTEAQLVYQSNQGLPLFGRVQLVKGGFFGGNRTALSNQLRFRVGDTLSTEVTWDRNDISLPGGAFVTNLSRARVSWSFTPRVFVQSLIQYNDRANIWSTNFRFAWLQAANTGLFVVYTDSHLMDDLAAARFNPAIGRTDRTFIVKISRMFDVLQ